MQTTRILIVEDNKDAAAMYATALRMTLGKVEPAVFGGTAVLEVDLAANVSSAHRRIASHSYDLVIVDLKIPGASTEDLGGLEVAATMAKADPLCPVLIITGYGTTDRVRRSFLLGVFDVLEKSPTFVKDLTAAAQAALAQRRNRLVQVGNPFVAVPGREPAVFGGRQFAFEFFQERLSRAVQAAHREHFVVLGGWGMGKSTLLKQFKKIAQAQGLLASTVSLEPTGAEDERHDLTKTLIQCILRDVPVPRLWLKGVMGYLESVGVKILGGGFEIKFAPSEERPSTQNLISDTLYHLWNDIKDRTGLFVLLLDDIEHQQTAPEVLLVLRSVLESERLRDSNILVVLASPPNHWIELAKRPEHRRLPYYFRLHVELSPLQDAEILSTVASTLRNTGVTFAPEIMAQICAAVQGHPGKLQLLCYNLYKNQRGGRVTPDAWELALNDTLDQLGLAMYEGWFDGLSHEHAKILSLLATTSQYVPLEDLLGSRVTVDTPSVREALVAWLDDLCRRQVLTREGQSYAIQDNLIATYIRRELARNRLR
jgi:CheY-like chemotaxis protein